MEHEDLLAKELDEFYRQAWNGERRGRWVSSIRRILAYTLKTIAAGGSLIVATDLFPHWNQQIGIAVLIAILVDTISSNHNRLIVEVEAGYAFRSLTALVKAEFNRDLETAKRVNQSKKAFETAQHELKVRAHRTLFAGIQDILKKRHDVEIKALQLLSLDSERAIQTRQ